MLFILAMLLIPRLKKERPLPGVVQSAGA